MSNQKPEIPESQHQPVKGPFSRTVRRTYELAPITINVTVTEIVEASHDVMIPDPDGCICQEESASVPNIQGLTGVNHGIPFIAILERVFRGQTASPQPQGSDLGQERPGPA